MRKGIFGENRISLQYKKIKDQINKAIFKTIKSGSFILGEEVKKLEEKIAGLTGTKYAIGVNSGTDALFLSLKAFGIKKGDEVITTPFSFIATAEAIANTGAKPVFVDIDPKTFNINVLKIKEAITKRTKAIIPVHLYGQMAGMKEILKIAKKHKLFVVEDAAQAIGAKQKINGKWKMAGGVGHIGCFSFFPTKNLGAFGDGGIITTNDKNLAEKIKLLRNHGATKKYYHEVLGISSRLDELQAAIILAKFPCLKAWNIRRNNIAKFYNKSLKGIDGITVPETQEDNYHIYHQYTIRTKHRDALKNFLEKNGVPTAIHYPIPFNLQPVFNYLGYKKGFFLEAEKAAKEVLSLPIYPELNSNEQNQVVEKIKQYFKING
ncbi:MAG: DegT/DnrJ/EryC1/StrS family aminotransferase [Candidatus Paceibacterota bacterium]|jgi:dTDP-4-amino-4,6-dideoxygalactose transaminase